MFADYKHNKVKFRFIATTSSRMLERPLRTKTSGIYPVDVHDQFATSIVSTSRGELMRYKESLILKIPDYFP